MRSLTRSPTLMPTDHLHQPRYSPPQLIDTYAPQPTRRPTCGPRTPGYGPAPGSPRQAGAYRRTAGPVENGTDHDRRGPPAASGGRLRTPTIQRRRRDCRPEYHPNRAAPSCWDATAAGCRPAGEPHRTPPWHRGPGSRTGERGGARGRRGAPETPSTPGGTPGPHASQGPRRPPRKGVPPPTEGPRRAICGKCRNLAGPGRWPSQRW